MEKSKQKNLVAKHMHKANKSMVFIDRKRNDKLGYEKHKTDYKQSVLC